MEEIKKERDTVKSFRADDETFEKFKKIATDEFGSQGQCLAGLINLYETETSKVALVERKFEIESFQDYLNKISNLFLTSLQLNTDAEARIREGFARQLTLKEQNIESLQEKATQLKEETQKAKASVSEVNEKYNELEKINASLEKDKKTLEGLVNKNDELLSKNKDEIAFLVSQVNEYKSYKEENVKLLSEIETLRKNNQEFINSTKSKDLDINSLNKELSNMNDRIVELKNDLKEEKHLNEKLRSEHKQELAAVEEKFNVRLNKEIEAMRVSFNERLEIEKKTMELTVKSSENEKIGIELAHEQEIQKLTRKINDQESIITAFLQEKDSTNNTETKQ